MTDYQFREAEDEIDKPFWFKFWDWLVDYDRPLLGFLFRLPIFIILLLGIVAVVMWLPWWCWCVPLVLFIIGLICRD